MASPIQALRRQIRLICLDLDDTIIDTERTAPGRISDAISAARHILGPALSAEPAYVKGLVEVQDEGSQLLAGLVDAKRGEMVADFCAGAGGKTLALGAAMRNTGRLYAFDTSAHRLDALKPRLARSGLPSPTDPGPRYGCW